MAVARQRFVGVELAEAAAEGDVLLARDLLVAEQQDAFLQEGAMDLVELRVAGRLGEIDAGDLGAERVGKRSHGNGHSGSSAGERSARTVRPARRTVKICGRDARNAARSRSFLRSDVRVSAAFFPAQRLAPAAGHRCGLHRGRGAEPRRLDRLLHAVLAGADPAGHHCHRRARVRPRRRARRHRRAAERPDGRQERRGCKR